MSPERNLEFEFRCGFQKFHLQLQEKHRIDI